AEAVPSPQPSLLDRLGRRSELVFAIGFVGVLAVMLLPIPGSILSALIAMNLALSLLILLVCIYAKEPLDFNAFPSLLLATTMFRLGLNVASTRLILLTGSGGGVIETFGQYVVGGNFVVGVVIFVVLVIIQLVVITKGAGRISEVAARFVLDAMPGKQMAIDADLNAGLINENQARERRKKVESEAEFYGAMDGASKFVKGDAIAGLIITVINIVAGFIIGMTMMNMSAGESLTRFTLLTIGDGLVSQIPSLLITVGSGLLVTKTRSNETVGSELAKELFLNPRALQVAAGFVLLLGLIPGMPLLPFALLAGAIFKATEAAKTEEKPEDLLGADRIGVEIGYRLIPLVDKERGGTLLDRVTALRKQLVRELGWVVPPVRIKDNIQLPPTAYRVMVYGQPAAKGELFPDRLLAIDGGGVQGQIQGQATKEPAFGLDAVWIESGRRAEAEALGYTVTDPASVFITHLTQVLRQQAAAVLNREDVQAMLGALKREAPALVKEIETNAKTGTVQRVLAALLEERVPVTNLEKILETIADQPNASAEALCESARARIGRAVVAPHLDGQGRLVAIILEPATEARLSQALLAPAQGGGLGIAPGEASALVDQLGQTLQQAHAQGHDPVLLTTASLRRSLRQITARFHPDLAVLSYSEIGTTTPVEVAGTIGLGK
ncbi:MAG: flagellar biosynthesis protein FlhA, partial [Planctomycetota bacterium]